MRASSLILASLGFIHDLRAGILPPDEFRGTPLDMSQYLKLFGTARIPTRHGCRLQVDPDSRHVIVMRRGQFYWFDVSVTAHSEHLSSSRLTPSLPTRRFSTQRTAPA